MAGSCAGCGCTCGEDIAFGGSCGNGCCSCCCSCCSSGGRLVFVALLPDWDCFGSCSWFGRRLACSFLVAVLLSECDDELDASIYVSNTILGIGCVSEEQTAKEKRKRKSHREETKTKRSKRIRNKNRVFAKRESLRKRVETTRRRWQRMAG